MSPPSCPLVPPRARYFLPLCRRREQVLFASLRISQRKFYDTKPFCAVFKVTNGEGYVRCSLRSPESFKGSDGP